MRFQTLPVSLETRVTRMPTRTVLTRSLLLVLVAGGVALFAKPMALSAQESLAGSVSEGVISARATVVESVSVGAISLDLIDSEGVGSEWVRSGSVVGWSEDAAGCEVEGVRDPSEERSARIVWVGDLGH
jgi:hypothetical protein